MMDPINEIIVIDVEPLRVQARTVDDAASQLTHLGGTVIDHQVYVGVEH